MHSHLLLVTLTALSLSTVAQPVRPLRVLAQNPHYFEYNGKPTVIVGSGEHYGSVVNLNFDYKTYLNTIAADGLNTTRLFTGAYIEKLGDFGIQRNTLAPASERLVLPWQRSNQPGYALGGNKFDLERWDGAYFTRLHDFMDEAARQGVIVEVNLFSSYYGTGWPYAAFNPANNVNGTDNIDPKRANTLQNGNILTHQERYVRKLVQELNRHPNLYFEIQNEPWADLSDTTLTLNPYQISDSGTGQQDWRGTLQVVAQRSNDWQRRVAEWITSEEKKLPQRHLISLNISNFRYPVVNPDPNVTIFNFHYATPEAVTENRHLNTPVGFNETGFAGRADQTYRRQAWRFLMAGGALFNHLDYSFSLGNENGQDSTFRAPKATTPGGGGPALRRQFGILKRLADTQRFYALKPTTVDSPGAMTWAMLGGRQYVVYAEPVALNGFQVQLPLPPGKYSAAWTDVVTGEVLTRKSVTATGGVTRLEGPAGLRDVVLVVK